MKLPSLSVFKYQHKSFPTPWEFEAMIRVKMGEHSQLNDLPQVLHVLCVQILGLSQVEHNEELSEGLKALEHAGRYRDSMLLEQEIKAFWKILGKVFGWEQQAAPVKNVTQPTTSVLPMSQRLASGPRDPQLHAQAAGPQQATFPVIKKYVTRDELEQTPHSYVLRNMAESRHPILSIKYIREVTGWGLKESKEYWDNSEYRQIHDQVHAQYVKMVGYHTSGNQPTLAQRILAILNEPYTPADRYDRIRDMAQYYDNLR